MLVCRFTRVKTVLVAGKAVRTISENNIAQSRFESSGVPA